VRARARALVLTSQLDVETPACLEKPLPTLGSKKLRTAYCVCVIGPDECWLPSGIHGASCR